MAAITNVCAGGVAVFRKRTDNQSRLLLSLGLFGLGLTHQAAQRLDLMHVLYAVVISVSILPLAIFTLLQRNARERNGSIRDGALAVATVVILLGAFVPKVGTYFRDEITEAVRKEFFCQHEWQIFSCCIRTRGSSSDSNVETAQRRHFCRGAFVCRPFRPQADKFE